jgi:hypothetical protein
MFEKLKSVALKFLGKENFDHDESGKLVLNEEEREKLTQLGGEDFMQKFELALEDDLSDDVSLVRANEAFEAFRADSEKKIRDLSAKHEEDMKALGSQLESEATARQEAEARVESIELAKKNADLKIEELTAKVEVLSMLPEKGNPEEVIQIPKDAIVSEPWHGKKANRNFFHNSMAFNQLNGKPAEAILARTNNSFSFGDIKATGTIDASELAEEFGDYMSQFNIKLEIMKLLTYPTQSQQYMTTKMAINSWKASKSHVSSVVQQFVSKWTPLGSSTFTPMEIINRRHKVNMPITPDDITDGWLSYLYNEQVTPDKMPITRYVVEELLRPQIDEDIEMKLIATGEYEDLGVVTEGQAGQATGKSMDGYLTILKDIKADPENNANFYEQDEEAEWYNAGVVDETNVLEVIEDYAKWVTKTAPLYHSKGMDLLIDPEVLEMFKYAYRDAFPLTKNEDGSKAGPDFSKLRFAPIEAMRGSGIWFCTPKENFIRLIHQNEAAGATRIFLQVQNYDVKVFAEFWLACGFALQELIFAYVPETENNES